MQNNNPHSRELLRTAILLQLSAASPAALSKDLLLQGLHIAGFKVNTHTLDQTLFYLAGKSFVESIASTLSQGHLRYQITPTAQDYLESQNLI